MEPKPLTKRALRKLRCDRGDLRRVLLPVLLRAAQLFERLRALIKRHSRCRWRSSRGRSRESASTRRAADPACRRRLRSRSCQPTPSSCPPCTDRPAPSPYLPRSRPSAARRTGCATPSTCPESAPIRPRCSSFRRPADFSRSSRRIFRAPFGLAILGNGRHVTVDFGQQHRSQKCVNVGPQFALDLSAVAMVTVRPSCGLLSTLRMMKSSARFTLPADIAYRRAAAQAPPPRYWRHRCRSIPGVHPWRT